MWLALHVQNLNTKLCQMGITVFLFHPSGTVSKSCEDGHGQSLLFENGQALVGTKILRLLEKYVDHIDFHMLIMPRTAIA